MSTNLTLFKLGLAAIGFSLFSCELEKEEVKPEDQIVYGDTIVHKSGKGFSPIAIFASELGNGVGGGLRDKLGIVDMTVTPDGKILHMAASSSMGTQQDVMNSLRRTSYNLETEQFVSPPTSDLGQVSRTNFNSMPLGLANRSFGFQPGTSNFYYATRTTNSSGVSTGRIEGDITYSRTNTFGGLPRVVQNGEIIENPYSDFGIRLDGNYYNRLFLLFQNKAGTAFPVSISNTRSTKAECLRPLSIEPSPKAGNHFLLFSINATKLFVSEIDASIPYSETLQSLDSMALPVDFDLTLSSMATRASDDGTQVGIVLGDGKSDLGITSAYFNWNTKKLTQNITKLVIPSFGLGSVNYDIDESGNMYFDNFADNFQSTNTISIYKASGSAFQVVGLGDIIKSGSVTLVRYLKGKVYAGVSYSWSTNKSNLKNLRVAVLRQD